MASTPVDIGDRREVFWDDYLLEDEKSAPAGLLREGAAADFRLETPVKKEIVLRLDKPWEGNLCNYYHCFHDGKQFRLYYRASDGMLPNDNSGKLSKGACVCALLSDDGIKWERPNLGLIEFNGDKNNNIIFKNDELDNFFVFMDTNPECPPTEQFKAITQGRKTKEVPSGNMLAFVSPDGFSWTERINSDHGDARLSGLDNCFKEYFFDSLNTAHWNMALGKYRLYYRGTHGDTSGRFRDIRLAVSDDFFNWRDEGMLVYNNGDDVQLYTNGILPYFRAPHMLVGFPVRYVERKWEPMFEQLPHKEWRADKMKRYSEPRLGTALTDCLFMTGRDGLNFKRYDEPFLKPGIFREHNWVYGDCYQSWGLLETPDKDSAFGKEISFFTGEDYTSRPVGIRRYTIRPDGFACLHAGGAEKQILTRPLVFTGNVLTLNMSTGAAGYIAVEFFDAEGRPVQGFSGKSSYRMFGDDINLKVIFLDESGAQKDLSRLIISPIRIRFTLKEAKLYSMQFIREN